MILDFFLANFGVWQILNFSSSGFIKKTWLCFGSYSNRNMWLQSNSLFLQLQLYFWLRRKNPYKNCLLGSLVETPMHYPSSWIVLFVSKHSCFSMLFFNLSELELFPRDRTHTRKFLDWEKQQWTLKVSHGLGMSTRSSKQCA